MELIGVGELELDHRECDRHLLVLIDFDFQRRLGSMKMGKIRTVGGKKDIMEGVELIDFALWCSDGQDMGRKPQLLAVNVAADTHRDRLGKGLLSTDC